LCCREFDAPLHSADPDTSGHHGLAGPLRTVTLQVQNICETRPIVVRKGLQRVSGVSSAHVDFALKTATVTFDPDQVKPAALTQVTTNAGSVRPNVDSMTSIVLESTITLVTIRL
jgi:copper chaperone CopZ